MGMAELLAQARARKTTALQRVEPPFIPPIPPTENQGGMNGSKKQALFFNELDDKKSLIPPIPPIPPQKHQSLIEFGDIAHKQELVEYLSRQATNDNTTQPAVDWHQADRAYQAHHWSCPQCQASGKGYGPMCDEGQRLWDAYEAAPMSELGKAKRVTTPLPPAAPAPQTPPRMTPRSGAEIVRMIGLHRRALSVGLPDSNDTDKAIDRMMDAPSDMACCFACSHLRGSSPERWRCAGHGHELSGLPLARVFVVQLHRCAGYEPPPMT
jgi:hypothetical protein